MADYLNISVFYLSVRVAESESATHFFTVRAHFNFQWATFDVEFDFDLSMFYELNSFRNSVGYSVTKGDKDYK